MGRLRRPHVSTSGRTAEKREQRRRGSEPRVETGTKAEASAASRSGSSRAQLLSHPPPVPSQGAHWLYGRHAVIAALANPKRRVLRTVATASTAARCSEAAGRGSCARPPIEILDRSAFDALLPSEAVHQGFAVQVAPLPAVFLEDVLADIDRSGHGTLCMLDQVTDPRNVGAVLRSAAAFGIAAVIVQERHSPEATGALAKAASGALESVSLIAVTNLSRALESLAEAGFWRIGLAGDASAALAGDDRPPRLALVIGAEDTGLRRNVRAHCDAVQCIPMTPLMESLNVSVAAAIAFYECRARVTSNVTVTPD